MVIQNTTTKETACGDVETGACQACIQLSYIFFSYDVSTANMYLDKMQLNYFPDVNERQD